MTRHTLKLHEKYFDAVKNGIKTFEIRKADRDYKVGDTLHLVRLYVQKEARNNLHEVCGVNPSDYIDAAVTYILTHDDFPVGIPEGYVVMGIAITGGR